MKKELFLFLIVFILILCTLGLYFTFRPSKGATQKIDLGPVSKVFDSCDEEQAKINMPTFPDCSMLGLKKLQISREVARQALSQYLEKSGADLDSLMNTSKFWSDAWEKYYGTSN